MRSPARRWAPPICGRWCRRSPSPTLVVCGEQELPAFQEAARFLAETIAGARLQWLGPARHCSILQQPEEFRRALRTFLA